MTYDPFEPGDRTSDPRPEEQRPAAPGYPAGAPSYPVQASPARETWSPAGPSQASPAPQQPAAYTWTPQSPAPAASPYYGPVRQPVQKKPEKKTGRFLLQVLAAALVCLAVSLTSVGVFALMIRSGAVTVQSPGSSDKTAAFTIYKRAESTASSTPTVTVEELTPQEIAKKLIPSVVCVQNYQITYYSYGYGYGYGYGDSEQSGISPAGEGSGIILSAEGYIVTNQHVVDGATNLKVVTYDGQTYEAELVGEDTQTDLAVIKITTDDPLTPAEFGSSEDLQVLDEVIAIGNPGGLQLSSSCTFGRVSALNRPITNSDTGYTTNCIQTDASINPGNSGGALVDMDGHVVGINSSKIVSTSYEGLGFAIPSDTVQPIVSDLIQYGYVKDRAAPGFAGQYIDRLRASWYGLSAGYYITQITSRNASDAGLRRGDVVTAIDDVQVTSGTTIANYIAGKKPGDRVTLTLDRSASGKENGTVELVLTENTGLSD